MSPTRIFLPNIVVSAVTPAGSLGILAEVTSWLNWRVFVSVFQSVVFQRFDEDVWVMTSGALVVTKSVGDIFSSLTPVFSLRSVPSVTA